MVDVVIVVLVAGSGVVVVAAGAGTLHAMPGGSHPPLQQVPPPSAVNGSAVEHVHAVVLVVVVAVGTGVALGSVVVVLDGGALHDIPGGTHPPSQHVPPPSEVNGSGVVHEDEADGAGDDDGDVGVVRVDEASVAETSFDGPLVSPPSVYASTAK